MYQYVCVDQIHILPVNNKEEQHSITDCLMTDHSYNIQHIHLAQLHAIILIRNITAVHSSLSHTIFSAIQFNHVLLYPVYVHSNITFRSWILTGSAQ